MFILPIVWPRHALAVVLLGGALVAPPAESQEPPPSTEESTLPPVVVTAPPPVSASSELFIPGRDFELRPQGRPADVMRLIPGLVISQHQGGGKAEQYFLRGFDADHGTDIAIFVDGLPVNLRSHAHGQGYADLHFLIPETVLRLEGFKGPYFVEYGDFATAGAVNFVLRDVVEENYAEAAGGTFATQRYLTLLSPTRDALKTLIAIEYYRSDGPFEHPNGYERLNLFARAKVSVTEGMDLAIWASYYGASWHGSGEIPVRRSARDSSRASAPSIPMRAATPSGPTSTSTGAGARMMLRPSPSAGTGATTPSTLQQLHVLPQRPRKRGPDQSA